MRRVVFVIYEGVQSLDLVGPHEVFEHANSLTGGYRCEVVAPAPGAVRSHSGLSLHAGHGIADLPPDGVDTLVVEGGLGVDDAVRDAALVEWISAAADGREVAHAVARELVLFLRRPGSQSQFSVPLWGARPATDPIREAVAAVNAEPGARHGIVDLAARAGLSPRHLQRRFTAELGVPPAAYVERVRVEAARRALAEADDPVEAIARRLGFGSAETLRRAFHRHVGVAPSDYRERFRALREYA